VATACVLPIRAFALADPNVAYPRDTMLDLERAGVIGRYADNAVSMVDSISQFDELATEVAPRIAEEFKAMGADLVLVVPFCPQCHVAFGILARAIERRGVPTASITTLYKQASYLKPPRASFLDFPLGCTVGRPREKAQQREIVKAALQHAEQAREDWELNRLPFQWAADGNRDWKPSSGISTAPTTQSAVPLVSPRTRQPTCRFWAAGMSVSSPSGAPAEL
jgi:hypothetical protein